MEMWADDLLIDRDPALNFTPLLLCLINSCQTLLHHYSDGRLLRLRQDIEQFALDQLVSD